MYSLDSLTVENWYLLRAKTTLDFKPGLTRIGGLNRSGKSLLAAAIPTLLSPIYDKDGWDKPPKNSSLHLRYHKDETAIDFAIITNSSAKYHFGMNGEDAHPHKITDAKNLLLKNWTIPQELFNSTIYLKTTDHKLTGGTAGSRSQWLSEALDLTSIYDAYKIEVDQKLSDLGKLSDKRQVLLAEREKVQLRLPESNISKKQAEKAAILLKKHRRILQKLPQQVSALENAIRLIDQLADLPDVDQPLTFYEDKLDHYRMEVARLTKSQAKLDEIRDIQTANAKIRKTQAKIVAAYPGIAVALSFNKLDKLISDTQQQIKVTEREKQAYEEQLEAYEEQTAKRKAWKVFTDYPIITKTVAKAETRVAELRYELNQARDKLENLSNVDSAATSCPTCGSDLTPKHRKQEIKKLTFRCNELPSEIEKFEREVRYHQLKKTKWIAKPKPVEFADIDTLEDMIKAADRFQHITEDLQPVEKIKASDIDTKLKEAKRKSKRYSTLRHAAVNAVAIRGMLPEEIQEESTDNLKLIGEEYSRRLNDIRDKRQRSSDIVSKYGSIDSEYQTQRRLVLQHRSTIDRLSGEIDELAEEIKDIPSYKALSLAFGNSGVRLYQLRESAAVLASKLTELSALFFDTTYNFNIEVAPHKLNVLVERNGLVGSLKTLSGSEQSSWNLLCAMAMMRILPSHMRCDTIFLDEIEAKMDKPSRDRLIRDVIPEVQLSVPKIVMITPLINGEMPIVADHDYRMLKRRTNGKFSSTLEQV